MKHFLSTAAFLLFVFVVVSVVPAQETPKVIKGGVLNGKAISLPKPAYPEEAKAGKLEGMARIKVVINEEGLVESAEPVYESIPTTKTHADGTKEEVLVEPADPILLEAARSAALQAKFSPTRLSGNPVKVEGVITYNFVAGGTIAVKGNAPAGGGVLNGNAESLPSPGYPPAAKAVKAAGIVAVQVVIDEEGNVISASAISGHPLLRAAAVEAAREAKFKPTKLSGEAVKVSGVLTYNFVLPDEGKN
jgi:TonB family protein